MKLVVTVMICGARRRMFSSTLIAMMTMMMMNVTRLHAMPLMITIIIVLNRINLSMVYYRNIKLTFRKQIGKKKYL